MRKMPKQKPGKSRQDYETPNDLIDAVVHRFGPLAWDLAATAKNSKAPMWINRKLDTFTRDWSQLPGNLWLNPPFARIDPWAEKCKNTLWQLKEGANTVSISQSNFNTRIFLLTPAAVGSNWFMNHVWGNAAVIALNPRLTFVGEEDPYPKDLILSVFGLEPSFSIWRWRP